VLLLKYNGNFLVYGCICNENIHEISINLSGDISQIVENFLSRNVEESFKQFLDPYSDAYLQNLRQFFLGYRHIGGKIFVKVR